MATLINNAGVQHYANKMVLAENRKVGSKSLPTALNDIDLALDEMKILFDAEYGSALDMKLNNNENVFSVGTGSGVDKKADVENSFTDVELKGDTLVNLVTTKGGNLFGTSGSGITFNRTYNADLTRCIYTTKEEVSSYITLRTGSKERIKPNTTYTLIFNIFKNNISELKKGISIRGSSDPYYTQTNIANYFNIYTDSRFILTSGIKAISFTTGNDTNEYTGFGFGFPIVNTSIAGQQFEIGDVILLEGDWTNHPLPNYFEGMKSVGEVEGNKIEVLSRGKNLCPITEYSIYNVPIGQNTNGYRDTIIARNIRVKPNTKYAIYVKDIVGASDADLKVMTFRDKIAETGLTHVDCYNNPNRIKEYAINKNSFNATITTESDANYINLTTGGFLAESSTIAYVDLQIVEGSTVDSIDSYKEDKKQILLNEPLRGVGDVKDTIEKVNGEWKIVRRCGEIILNGSESWSLWSYYGSEIRDDRDVSGFGVKLPLAVSTTSTKVICNNFATGGTVYNANDDNTTNHTYYTKSKELIYCYYANANTNQILGMSIKNSKLGLDSSNWNTTVALANFKNWLSQNPTKVIYQLDTPIIEDVSPVTLQCWKNGTISIDEILPVESTHTVALNKPAQIKRNIEELTKLRDRVETLEAQYDQIALEQAYQLELINHSFELDYI